MAKKIKPQFDDDIGYLVEDVVFSQNDISCLEEILLRYSSAENIPEIIDALRKTCELGRSLYQEKLKSEPTASQVRAALDNIENHASELATAIRHADIRTACMLTDIFYFKIGDWKRRELLLGMLDRLAQGVIEERRTVPKSYGKRTQTLQVKLIDDTLKRRGITLPVSSAGGSPFFAIACICFTAMRIHARPDSAIENYKISKAAEANSPLES